MGELIYVVYLLIGFSLGMVLSIRKPTANLNINLPNIREYIIQNSRVLFIIFGMLIGIAAPINLSQEQFVTIRTITLGLFSASGLIFTFVVKALFDQKNEKDKNNKLKGVNLEWATQIKEENKKYIEQVKKTLINGILCLTFYVLVLMIIILESFVKLDVIKFVFNIGMFTLFMMGFSFFIDIFEGLELLLKES